MISKSLGLSIAAAAPRGAAAREADVLGDLEQPGRLGLGHDAATECAERVHVRRLDRVLSLFARAELMQAVALELRGVTFVEALGSRRLRGDARALDKRRTSYGRNCGQRGSPLCLEETEKPAFRPNAWSQS